MSTTHGVQKKTKTQKTLPMTPTLAHASNIINVVPRALAIERGMLIPSPGLQSLLCSSQNINLSRLKRAHFG